MVKGIKRKPTEKQVMAWLYMVAGPVIDGLKRESPIDGALVLNCINYR